MGRTHINTIKQPDENTCGPVSIQHALAIFGQKKSVTSLTRLCRTTSYGTTTNNMIRALRKLKFHVLSVEKATLTHVLSALRTSPNVPRAIIVSYVYDSVASDDGHWATVCSYRASQSRIVLFDSYTGKRKSYAWVDFCARWKDYELRKRKITSRTFRFIKKWRQRPMLVVASTSNNLPSFQMRSAKIHTPIN